MKRKDQIIEEVVEVAEEEAVVEEADTEETETETQKDMATTEEEEMQQL